MFIGIGSTYHFMMIILYLANLSPIYYLYLTLIINNYLFSYENKLNINSFNVVYNGLNCM